MAEGHDFGYEVWGLDYNIDHDDDDQEGDATRPFQPGAASTPYHGGEQYEMQTMQHEQSELPDISYDEETSWLRKAGSITDLQRESLLRQKMKKSVDVIKAKFPKANFEIIKIRRGSGKNLGKIVAIGSKEGGVQDFKRRWVRAQDREIIQKQRKRLAVAENQKRQANTLAAEMEKKFKRFKI